MTMANDFSGWGVTAEGAPIRPSWLGDMATYRDPQQEWDALMSQVQPFWQTRAPMADLGQRLQARYLLSAPRMAETLDPSATTGFGGYTGVDPSFSAFLQGYPGRFGTGGAVPAYSTGFNPALGMATNTTGERAELRNRAREAATAAAVAPGAYLAGVTPGTNEFNRRAWYSSQFGSGAENAAANQLAVANLLATRRPGGAGGAGTGAYTGQMANAIRRAMGNLYMQRRNLGNPQENFLNWYLDQTQPTATV